MDVESIKLYHYPASRSSRAKWALHETIGDDFEVEIVSLYDGEQFSPDYLAKNPHHNVPTLEIILTNGETKTLLESAAIVCFLADAFPEKNLAPVAHQFSQARANYQQMVFFAAVTIDMMLWQIRIHEHVLADCEADERTATRYRKKFITEVEPPLISRLKQHSYISGNQFSAADIIMGHCVMWAKMYNLCNEGIFNKYLSKLSKRPAFLKAYSDAGEFDPIVPKESRIPGIFNG